MEDPGIMLYGYAKDDASLIKNTLDTVLGCSISLLTGSSRESHILEDIISDEAYDTFEDKETKVLMFLGFDDRQINLTLEKFPAADKITRPIFCGLTENNLKWPLSTLLDHLIEERDYWSKEEKK